MIGVDLVEEAVVANDWFPGTFVSIAVGVYLSLGCVYLVAGGVNPRKCHGWKFQKIEQMIWHEQGSGREFKFLLPNANQMSSERGVL